MAHTPDTIRVTLIARTWHVRGQITSTVKDGFRPGEITVSCDYEDGDRPTAEDFTERYQEQSDLMLAECARLNSTGGA
jgi:hypothetical protein